MTDKIYALEFYNVEGELELLFFNQKGILDRKKNISTTQTEEPGTFTVFVLRPDIKDISELDSEPEVMYEGVGQISDMEKMDLGYEMAEELIQNERALLCKVCETWPSKTSDKYFHQLLEAINTRMDDSEEEE